jgi:hypothetical protein
MTLYARYRPGPVLGTPPGPGPECSCSLRRGQPALSGPFRPGLPEMLLRPGPDDGTAGAEAEAEAGRERRREGAARPA